LRDKKTERQKDRKTERQKDRKTERQKDRQHFEIKLQKLKKKEKKVYKTDLSHSHTLKNRL
jgi:hypothetical protein